MELCNLLLQHNPVKMLILSFVYTVEKMDKYR